MTYSGELWYREGLPSDVFRRLVVRKENETPLDRFSGDYEELMTYANFRDLADIIVGNEVLKDRLTVLEPRDGASLLDRLHELEEMRRSISSREPTDKDDEARLKGYFDEFCTAIKSAKAPAAASLEQPEPTPEPEEIEPEEETLDSIFDEDEPPAPEPAPAAKSRPGRLVVKVSSSGLHKAADESTPKPPPEKPAQPTEQWTSANPEVGSVETPVTEVSTRPRPDDSSSEGPVEEAERVERALREGDDAAILKALHIEVTEIADGMLRRDPKHGHLVWEVVGRRGWFDANQKEFELEPLERFYALADTFLEAFASGAKSSELKKILADAGFSKMLLELREMFLNSRSRV